MLLLGPRSFDVPALLLVVAAMAALAGTCTLVAVQHPQALQLFTTIGLAVVAGGIATFDVLMPAAGTPWNPAVSLMGTAALVPGLVLRLRPALAAALTLALWNSGWDLGAPQPACSSATSRCS